VKHKARKRFGQNFLQDSSVIYRILNELAIKPADSVLEIGPGLGALTVPLLQKLNKLVAVEIDRDLQEHLASLPNHQKLQLLTADALTIDYSQFGRNLRIIGNLPYNISTALMLHLMQYASYIEDMHFMLQKEVASRLIGEPGNKAYGRLSVMIQYYCQVDLIFDVPPQAFHPAPKVDSAIVRLIPYHVSPYEAVCVLDLEKLVMLAFGMRRKTLANNLKGVITAQQLTQLGIDPIKRPEQITLPEYINITNFIAKLVT
jgi:16S rRNA (adenine1518-N6/adenine1519-N6)-dimethyltransferase